MELWHKSIRKGLRVTRERGRRRMNVDRSIDSAIGRLGEICRRAENIKPGFPKQTLTTTLLNGTLATASQKSLESVWGAGSTKDESRPQICHRNCPASRAISRIRNNKTGISQTNFDNNLAEWNTGNSVLEKS